MECREPASFIRVEADIDLPEIKRLVIHRSVARHTLNVHEVISEKSTGVLTGAEFDGFTTNIGEFGLYHDGPVPGTTLELFREGDKFRIVTRRPGGQFRSAYSFDSCVNYP